jgi:hypothetical protein
LWDQEEITIVKIPPSRSPVRLIVFLHVLQVSALFGDPTLDTPFKCQTLHVLV